MRLFRPLFFARLPSPEITSLRVAQRRTRMEDGSWYERYGDFWLVIEFPSGIVLSLPFRAAHEIFAVSALHLAQGVDLVVLTRWSGTGTGYASHKIEIWRAFDGGLEKLFETMVVEFITRTPPGEYFYSYHDVSVICLGRAPGKRTGCRPWALEMRRVLRDVPQDLLKEVSEESDPLLCLYPEGGRLKIVAQDCAAVLDAAGKTEKEVE